MQRGFRIWILAVGLLIGVGTSASAQTVESPPALADIWAAYQRFDYAATQDLAQAALAVYDRYRPEELAEVYIILGLVAFSQDQRGASRRHFEQALDLDASITLDPLLISPKIRTFFEEVRAQYNAQPRTEPAAPGEVRYLIREDPRVPAALRSMVLPGWGQLHKGEQTKGRVLLGLWSVSAAGSLGAHFLRQGAERSYDASQSTEEAIARYDTFNRWHRTRNALLWGTGAVWLYGYLDALLASPSALERRTLILVPSASGRQVYLSVYKRF